MANQAQQQLDDILDARAAKRDARKAFEAARIAMNQARTTLSEATERVEALMDEVEQKQGRLPFEQAVEHEQAPTQGPYTQGIPLSRRGRKRKEQDAEGPRA
jgi:hypothetical protein